MVEIKDVKNARIIEINLSNKLFFGNWKFPKTTSSKQPGGGIDWFL
jgi:hypothetical protein